MNILKAIAPFPSGNTYDAHSHDPSLHHGHGPHLSDSARAPITTKPLVKEVDATQPEDLEGVKEQTGYFASVVIMLSPLIVTLLALPIATYAAACLLITATLGLLKIGICASFDYLKKVMTRPDDRHVNTEPSVQAEKVMICPEDRYFNTELLVQEEYDPDPYHDHDSSIHSSAINNLIPDGITKSIVVPNVIDDEESDVQFIMGRKTDDFPGEKFDEYESDFLHEQIGDFISGTYDMSDTDTE